MKSTPQESLNKLNAQWEDHKHLQFDPFYTKLIHNRIGYISETFRGSYPDYKLIASLNESGNIDVWTMELVS